MAHNNHIDYDEVQKDEVQALEAIHAEDFEHVATKSAAAWNGTTERNFKLKVRSPSEQDAFVTLCVKLTRTYPRTAAVLSVDGVEQFHERTVKKIRKIVHERPKQLTGDEPIIHIITEEIGDALEEAVTARKAGTLPSLEEERAIEANTLAKQAEEAEEAEERQRREAQEEDERMFRQLAQAELARQEKRKSLKPAKDITKQTPTKDAAPEKITFEQTARIETTSGLETFSDVSITGVLSKGTHEVVFLGKPITNGDTTLVSVKRRLIQKSKAEIIQLETVLADAQKLKHPNLLNIFAYRVSQIGQKTELYICREYAERGTLFDLLSFSELHLPKARQLTLELLQGLDYLHRHGMVHGYINARTVYLSSNPISPKLSGFGYSKILELHDDSLPQEWRFPHSNGNSQTQHKRDLWQLGVVVVQIFLGLSATNEYSSPSHLLAQDKLSHAFDEFLQQLFSESKKSVSCFQLIPMELLRTDKPIVERKCQTASPIKRRSRHNSANVPEPVSRYESEFTELSRLGKGGFGEVVKAQNRLDQGVYAVKKLKQSEQLLAKVLHEVILLNRLNHPYVVRYYATWIERSVETHHFDDEDALSSTSEESSPGGDFGYASTGGIDFVSSSHPGFEFGNDSDEDPDEPEGSEEDIFDREGEESGEEEDPSTTELRGSSTASTASRRLKKTRSATQRPPATLYIQMELCDKRSLRNLIRDGMSSEDVFRFARQITEGLAHIHGNEIIHRDLKPDNVFIDRFGNPKIGDFGLATTSLNPDIAGGSRENGSSDMTRSIGTALYVAPELQSTGQSKPNYKVDMYSLGIIIYEMCQPFSTAMERIHELQRIRKKGESLPDAYLINGEKAREGRLISCLIVHKPSERPSSTELLRDDRLPLNIEDDTMRKALGALTDPNSPYHQTFMSAVFAQTDNATTSRARSLAWDMKANTKPDDPERVRLRGITRSALETVFRRHCAEEVRRDFIFPRSHHYTSSDVMQLLDASGNVLQLPFDLTLPYARQLARQPASTRCTFTVSGAYRDSGHGGPPRNSVEADFDIINNDQDPDTTVNDAEILKVMDEVLSELPFFAPDGSVYYWMTHGRLVEAIMDYCRVPVQYQPQVKDSLSRLGFDRDWDTLQSELRKMGLSDTMLADLKKYDWHEPPEKAFKKLANSFTDATDRARLNLDAAVNDLRRIHDLATCAYGVSRKLLIRPFSCWNVKFYTTGMLFQCLVEDKKHKRSVIAAGGRYDSLIRAHRIADDTAAAQQGAVGLVFAVDTFVGHMLKTTTTGVKKKFAKQPSDSQQLTKRGDVLVVASDTYGVQTTGIKLVASLWSNGVSAELARDQDTRSMDHLFVVHLRHESSTTVRVTSTDNEAEDSDVPLSSLVSHIQQELRERAQRKVRMTLTRNPSSHQETERKGKVQVLMVERGGKKENKYTIVENAHQRWEETLEQLKDAEILAIEGKDSLLDLVQKTKMSDPVSWRAASQDAAPNERKYVYQIREALEGFQKKWEAGNGLRTCCVHHYRTGKVIYYDLGA